MFQSINHTHTHTKNTKTKPDIESMTTKKIFSLIFSYLIISSICITLMLTRKEAWNDE